MGYDGTFYRQVKVLSPMSPAHLLKLELKGFLPWHQARLDCLAHLILAMIEVRTVNLTQLALAFELAVQPESVYQRVKRFFRHHVFETDVVAVLVTNWLDLGERWVLCLDRTNWQLGRTPINILVLSVAYDGVAVPLMWSVLGKKGNSSTDERVALLERFRCRFPEQRIDCLTADREFRGHRWLGYLLKHSIPFRIRIPNNTQTHNRQRNARLSVTRLFPIAIGETMVLNRPRRLWGHTLYLVATRAVNGEYVIVVTTHAPQQALADYRKRWDIECLFAAMKRRGFNLEDTHITDPERVARLIAVMTLALCWCYKVGLWLDQQKPITIKKHQRRARSVIRLGFDTLRRVLLNGASKMAQIRHWIHFLFHKNVPITVS
jgi:hypothetical protein